MTTSNIGPEDAAQAIRTQAVRTMDLAEEAIAGSARFAVLAEKYLREYRFLNGMAQYAAVYLARVFGAEAGHGYLQFMFGRSRQNLPAGTVTVDELRVEHDAVARVLTRIVRSKGRGGELTLLDLAVAVENKVFEMQAYAEEEAAGHTRDKERVHEASMRAAHYELEAATVVDRQLRADRDEHLATLDLIDAEFPEYPTDGTPREIAIWNHLDNIDGSRDNVRRRDRKLQKTQAKLTAARQQIRELEKRLTGGRDVSVVD